MDLNSARDGRIRQAIVAALGLVVSVVSVLLVARSVDLADAGRVLAKASIGSTVLGLGVFLMGLGFRVLIWYVLLPDRPDGSRVRPARVAPVLMVGYLGNALLPARLGEVIRSYLISRREGVAFGASLGSVALERIIDIATLAVMAFVAAAWVGAASWIVQGTGVLALVAAILVFVLATTGFHPFVRLLGRAASIQALYGPVTAVVRRLDAFARWSGGAHRRRAMLMALGLSLAAWLCNAAMFWLVGQAVGASLSPAGALLLMAVTVLATAIPSAPAYVGTFELAAVTVAASLGVPGEAALALAVLAHALGLLPTAIGGPLALASLGGGLRNLTAAATQASLAESARSQSRPPSIE
jgi:glycosyltransferase 2 family protein